ncbi:MAG TPA: CD225/dispanin family protein [Stenotrophomonas sp.]
MSAVPPVFPPTPPTASRPIPNYLAWSIISTVLGFCLCCPALITGIVAIVFSSKVNSLLAQGDLDGAQRASANAKIWCWVTTALAIVGLIINIVLVATGGMQSYLDYAQQMQQMS